MDSTDGVRAISERSNGLRSSHAVDLVHTAQIGGNQRGGINRSIGRGRSTDDNTWNACYTGGRCEHIHHRGKGSFPSWHIQPHRGNGRNFLPGQHSRRYLGEPLLVGHLAFVKRADVANGMLKDRKSTRLNSSHVETSYAVFCLKKKRR